MILARSRATLVVGVCLVAGATPALAQKHTTTPPVSSWATTRDDGPGHTIWVVNYDSVPVVITRMRISDCINLRMPCRDSILEGRILASRESAQFAVLRPQDPSRPFSYRFGLDWRVAAECRDIASQVPQEGLAGAVTSAVPIEVWFPPNDYADKWSGFPVQFFVAANGTVDSTVMVNFARGPFRDIMQELFKEYRFRPARFRGCPIPSSTVLTLNRWKLFPKPSAYEGFPPSPAELARDTRSPRNPRSPAEPYVLSGACPFECCQYGEWRSRQMTPVYATQGKAAAPIFTLRPGDSVRAVTGNVHVLRVGRVRITRKVERGWAEFEEHKLPVLEPGDTVYVLSYAGEGHWEYWYRGLVGIGPELWSDMVERGVVPGQLLAEPVTEWWVQIIDRSGRSGWVLDPTMKFDGNDACG